MSAGGKLGWYARRLASMSAPELAHRVLERAKQAADARAAFGWDAFAAGAPLGFEGEIRAWPGLRIDAVAEALSPNVEAHARAVLRGDIVFLSAQWPQPDRPDWWRSNHWLLDPVSGEAWPGREARASKSAYRHAEGRGDVKFVWELNRLQFLMPLAAAARRDRDPALAETITDVLDGWMLANPPYQGVNWTNGIEFATRVAVAFCVHTLLGDLAPPLLERRLRPFLAAHVRMLARYPSLYSSANNHRVAELTALYLALKCAPGLPRALVPDHRVARDLEREILKQFHADGVGAEQSPTYAAYSLEWFLLAGMCGEAAGAPFSDAYRTRLRAAALHLRWIMDEAGRTPAIGDDDEGRVAALGPQRDYLYPAAVCATAARWLNDAAPAPPPQPQTLLDAFCPAKPAPSPHALRGAQTFAEGGYSVWRRATPVGPAMLAFDHGPLGYLSIAAHGHADALSLWLHVGAQPVIIDAATYLYHTHNGARDRFRATAAHNTLTLDEQSQSRIAGPFNWSDHARTTLLAASEERVAAAHDGYVASHGVRHVRAVRVSDQGVVIDDALDGLLRAPARWRAGFTIHPDIAVSVTAGAAALTLPGGARVAIAVDGAPLTLEDTEISTGFGHLATAQRLIWSGEAGGAGKLATATISWANH